MSILNSDLGISRIRELLRTGKEKIYMSGILGAGMRPLAELLHSRGYDVFGSDAAAGGEKFLPGTDIPLLPENMTESLHGVGLFVYTLAIPENSPLLLYARARGIPAVSRAELLGAVMQDFSHRIGISGTHGKSTTTAMVGEVLKSAGLDPTVVCGAELAGGSCLLQGGSEYLVYEACEYKDSFLKFSPTCAAVTNIELDHTDYFSSLRMLCDSFNKSVAGSDLTVFNADDPNSKELKNYCRRGVSFGFSKEADYRCERYELGSCGAHFTVRHGEEPLGNFSISVIGKGNLLDALCTVAVCHSLEVSTDDIREGLSAFSGVWRRLTLLGNVGGRDLYYDYAHHPTEILNTVATLKSLYGCCTVVFRPHTYSRTEALFDGFVSALGTADHAVVLDIYGAREQGSDRTAENLARSVGRGCVHLCDTDTVGYVLTETKGVIVLMGAGDMGKVKNDFEKMLT